MMMECRNIDELMMEFLYQELDASQTDAFRTHVGGCTRCAGELASLQATRNAVRALPELEPSPDVSARLLAAARRTPAVEVKGVTPIAAGEAKGVWAWLVSLFQPMALHPGFAAVAALVLVGGVAGFLALKGKSPSYQAKSESHAGAPAATAANQPENARFHAEADDLQRQVRDPAPAAPTAMPAVADETKAEDKKLMLDGEERVGRLPTPEEEQKAHMAVQRHAGPGVARGGAQDDGDAVAPEMAQPTGVVAPVSPQPNRDQSEAGNGGGGGASSDVRRGHEGPSKDADKSPPEPKQDVAKEKAVSPLKPAPEKKPATVKAPEPAPPPADANTTRKNQPAQQNGQGQKAHTNDESMGEDDSAGYGAARPETEAPMAVDNTGTKQESDAPAKSKPKKNEAAKLHGQARAKAATGNCAAAGEIKKKIYRVDPDYYDRKVRNDPDLTRCDANRAPAKKANGRAPAAAPQQPQLDREQNSTSH